MSKNRFLILAAAFLILGCACADTARGETGVVTPKNLLRELKKTIVFIGDMEKKDNITLHATGFMVSVKGVFHLVTAKHVVYDKETNSLKDDNMFILFNSKGKGINIRPIQGIKKEFKVDWVFHDKPEVDIAIIPFPLNEAQDDVKVIPDSMFTTSDNISELDDIFFMSYQPGIEPKTKILPILRNGIISLVDEDRTFYINAAAFPGNSGSPVFLKPTPVRFSANNIAIGDDKLGGTFIGVVGEYIPYQEVAVSVQTKKPRVVFEENTGLSKVWAVEFIKEIFESDVFKKQLGRIAKK